MKLEIKIYSLSLYFLAIGLFLSCWIDTLVNAIAVSPTSENSSLQIDKSNLYNFTYNVEALIPSDRASVDLMQLVPPPRLVELSQKFKTALQKNSDRTWLTSLIQHTPSGQPLPYDSRLGISQTEYQELLALSQKLIVKKVETSTLQVKHNGKKYIFIGHDSLAKLTGIELDLDRDILKTPHGVATELVEVVADADRQHLTGTWNGVMWKLEQFERQTNSKIKVQFSLGRLTQTGRGILQYDVTTISNRAVAKSTPLILQYDLPQPR